MLIIPSWTLFNIVFYTSFLIGTVGLAYFDYHNLWALQYSKFSIGNGISSRTGMFILYFLPIITATTTAWTYLLNQHFSSYRVWRNRISFCQAYTRDLVPSQVFRHYSNSNTSIHHLLLFLCCRDDLFSQFTDNSRKKSMALHRHCFFRHRRSREFLLSQTSCRFAERAHRLSHSSRRILQLCHLPTLFFRTDCMAWNCVPITSFVCSAGFWSHDSLSYRA